MGTTFINQRAMPATHAVDLAVAVADLTISVTSGPFTVMGKSYILTPNIEYIVTPDPTYRMDVWGSLVEVKATGHSDLLIDDVIKDDIDEPYQFDGSVYTLLHHLFHIRVPAGVTTLDLETLEVFRIIAEGGD